MTGGGPEPLALILARVGSPHVLPSMSASKRSLSTSRLVRDEEEDTGKRWP